MACSTKGGVRTKGKESLHIGGLTQFAHALAVSVQNSEDFVGKCAIIWPLRLIFKFVLRTGCAAIKT